MAETAIIVPVAEAEPIVGRWRRLHTPSGAAGMPAHITLLVPFRDSDALGPDEIRRASDVLARFPPIELALAASGSFEGPPSVLYLEPDPAGRFREMTEALVREFPEHPPYGDPEAKIVPHLTVATRLTREELAAIEAEVAQALPITARPAEAWLMDYAQGRWRRQSRFALGAAA